MFSFNEPFEGSYRKWHGSGIEVVYALPKTNTASENGWLGDNPFLLGWSIFGGELLVSGRVGGM